MNIKKQKSACLKKVFLPWMLLCFMGVRVSVSAMSPDLYQDAITDLNSGRLETALHKFLLFIAKNPKNENTDQALRQVWSIAHDIKKAEESRTVTRKEWKQKVRYARETLHAREASAEKLIQDLGTLARKLSEDGSTIAFLREGGAVPEIPWAAMDELSKIQIDKNLADIRAALKKTVDEGKLAPHDLHEAKGYFWYYEGDLEVAVQEWEASLSLNPANEALRKQLEQARTRWEAQKRKEEIQHELLSGRTYFKTGQYARAIAKFEKVLALDPLNEEARKFFNQSKDALDSAAKQEKIQDLMAEGRKHYESGRLADAIRAWVDILALDPTNEEARRFLSRIRKRLILVQEERPFSSPAAEAPPTGAQTPSSAQTPSESAQKKAEQFHSLGLIQYMDRDLVAAQKSFQEALKWNPNLQKAKESLDQTMRELKSR